MASKPQNLVRLAFTAMEAPAVLGVSDDFFRKHIASELRWVRLGSKKLVPAIELEQWLERSATRTLEGSDAA
jgi:excisionase family DNA binding protein